MNRQVKFQQLEGGTFTTSNNKVQINFASNEDIDLKQSYLEIDLEVKDNNTAQPVHLPEKDVCFGDHTHLYHYNPSSLVRHAQLETEATGILEQNRFQNIYDNSLRQYTSNKNHQRTLEVFGGGSQFTLDASAKKKVLLPLNQLLGMAEMNGANRHFPLSKMGVATLKLDLEPSVPVLRTLDERPSNIEAYTFPLLNTAEATNTIVVAEDFATDSFENIFKVNDVIKITHKNNTTILETKLRRIISVEASNKTLTLDESIKAPTNTTENLIAFANRSNKSALKPTKTDAGASKILLVSDTTSLVQGKAVSLLYKDANNSDKWTFVATDVIDNISANTSITLTSTSITGEIASGDAFIYQPLTQLDYTIHSIQLVGYMKEPKKGEYQYKTRTLEMINKSNAVDFRKQIETEENASRVVLLTPLNGKLISVENNIKDYRVSINFLDTTSEQIAVNDGVSSALYNDRLLNVLGATNLDRLNGDATSFVIPQDLPLNKEINTLQLRANYNSLPAPAEGILYAYKTTEQVV